MLVSAMPLFTRASKAPLAKTLPYPFRATGQLQTELKSGFLVTIRKEKKYAVLIPQTTGKQQKASRAPGAVGAEARSAQG